MARIGSASFAVASRIVNAGLGVTSLREAVLTAVVGAVVGLRGL